MFPSPESDPRQTLQVTGCLVASLMVFLACVLPFMLFDMAQQALANLHLSPLGAVLVLLGMLFGSAINVPIARYPLDEEVEVPLFEPIGGVPVFQRYRRLRREMVVAVNVGGCVIPVLLSIWLLRSIFAGPSQAVWVLIVGMLVNTAVCHRAARPIPRMGIALPFFLPALIALSTTWIGLQGDPFDGYRAPVAFIVGISGPLLGADLLHWHDFRKVSVGVVSIGGAGTWDGIVLSGMLAALFA